MKILLTGATGFVAAHILDRLLQHGHYVVAAVRSQAKADWIRTQYASECSSKQLDFTIVPDIVADGAFDSAVVANPPFDAIVHSASPVASARSAERVVPDIIDPALRGTTNMLKAAHAFAPSVKRIVLTSSFAAIVNWQLGNRPGHTYSEQDWNPIELADALQIPTKAYQTSKKLAERAAWDFVEARQPAFDLVTMNPPMVFGPVRQRLDSLDELNQSNQRVCDMMLGRWRDQIAETLVPAFCDVRDVAAAHVSALETPAAGGKRFFLAAATYTNQQIAAALRNAFPKYLDQLPTAETPGGGPFEEGVFSIDHTQAEKVLGLKFRSLEESVVDLGRSLAPLVDAALHK